MSHFSGIKKMDFRLIGNHILIGNWKNVMVPIRRNFLYFWGFILEKFILTFPFLVVLFGFTRFEASYYS